jgi:hypothetical protein
MMRATLALLLLASSGSPLAAGLWFLLTPPRDDRDASKVLESAPLSQWRKKGGFGSTIECEKARTVLVRAERDLHTAIAKRYLAALNAGEAQATLAAKETAMRNSTANLEALDASLCIKSDDPGLRN